MVTRVEGSGKGVIRESGMDRYTLLYLKRITNKDLQYSTGNSARCYVAAWMGGEFGEECVSEVQLCWTFCNPMDCSPPGSSVHRISQERTLEWVLIPFSRGSSQCRDLNPALRVDSLPSEPAGENQFSQLSRSVVSDSW